MSSQSNSLYFGFVVSLGCLGVVLLQYWNYCTVKFKEQMALRLLVTSVMILSIISSCFNVVTVHEILVLEKAPKTTYTASMCNSGILFFLVHSFFGTRIFLLTKKLPIPAIIMITSAVMLALSFYMPLVKVSDSSSRAFFLSKELPLLLFHASSTVTDIIISFTLYHALKIPKTNTLSNSPTLRVLNRLLIASITRGIALAALQVCHLVLIALKPYDMLFWASTHMVLDQLYTITMLMMLNSRTIYSDTDGSVVEMSYIDFATITD